MSSFTSDQRDRGYVSIGLSIEIWAGITLGKANIIHPSKVKRESLERLTDLPNIGPSIAGDLRQIGIHSPTDIIGRDPYVMHEELCTVTGQRHDPCIIDVFISITRFMAGEPPCPWWDYTAERKKRLLSDN